MKECVTFVCVSSLTWTLVWLAPGGTQYSECVCAYVLPQTIAQMVMVGPTTLKRKEGRKEGRSECMNE